MRMDMWYTYKSEFRESVEYSLRRKLYILKLDLSKVSQFLPEGYVAAREEKLTKAADMLAHVYGGVPNVMIEMGQINETNMGYLIYFFEYVCGLSGYLLGVNPFDQAGVEAYKKNMFALLGKPGYEDMKAALEARL